MKESITRYGGADIHRFAGAGNRAPWRVAGLMNFLHWKLLFAIIGAAELAGLGVTDF